MSKKVKTSLTILIIILIAGIIAYPKVKPLLAQNQTGQGKGNATGKAVRQLLNVSGYLIKPATLSEFVKSTGTIRPDEEVDMSFETSGKIVSIKFTEGTRVKKGQLLAKINDKPLQAQLQKLLAQRKLTEGIEFRQKSLLDKDAISQESYDQIVTELQTIEADINLIKARISETELTAPFDGIVGLRYLSEGAYVTSATKIAKLIKLSPVKIEFSIPEKFAQEIKIGFPVTFSVVGDTDNYTASVYAVDPKIDLDTKTIILRALYPNNKEEINPGRFASIILQMSKVNDAISIPSEALVSEMEGEKVFVFKNNKAEEITVTTGLRTESNIQITQGLKFGDTLITTGILQLRQSLPVVLDTLITN
jgi:membrane fusion protein (multidrug efflux system)